MKLFDRLSWMIVKRRQTLPLSVNWRRVFVLPTRHGYMVALAILGVFAIGVRIQNNMLLLMAIALFVIFMFSLIWSATNLDKLQFKLIGKPQLFAGQANRLDVQPAGRRRMNDIWLRVPSGSDRTSSELAGPKTALPLSYVPEKRGRQSLPAIMVETRFPFGVARAWTFIGAGDVLVAPKPDFSAYRQHFHFETRNQALDFAGEQGADGLDSWTPGTPLNRISWKHYAASDKLLQKTGDEGGSSAVHFSYQAVAHLGHETALSILCAAILQAAERQLNFHLELPDQHFKDLTPGQIDKALDALALA